ncbi:hypothetical protein NPIL_5201 [Nephila pilipes]|uniref:Uncharacterized protein n=1 Tax=Nephila pilipes TaxID=299642 RepID=A0A8X6MBW1_NEPPI|nr:hypothetical protein NPIL_5201 [Nephila pilipes]
MQAKCFLCFKKSHTERSLQDSQHKIYNYFVLRVTESTCAAAYRNFRSRGVSRPSQSHVYFQTIRCKLISSQESVKVSIILATSRKFVNKGLACGLGLEVKGQKELDIVTSTGIKNTPVTLQNSVWVYWRMLRVILQCTLKF